VPDELAWLSRLAARFDVEVSPHASVVYDEAAARMLGGLPEGEVDEQAPLVGRAPYAPPPPAPEAAPAASAPGAEGPVLGELRLLRYRPLFSGPQVERVPELRFQRPEPVAELSEADAARRGLASGDAVVLRSNGTSVALRARVSRRLAEGVVRVAEEHAGELHQRVEVTRA
jgi:anaerobic selenocysteine-containing dehydrogenase